MVDNLVVHGAAEERVRMCHQRREWCVVGAGIQQGFETAVGTVEILKISDVGLKGHNYRV